MPYQSTLTDVRLESLAPYLVPIVGVLNQLNEAFAPPFVQAISKTTESLINLLQTVKQNKKECVQLVENIFEVLHAIISLHIKSEASGSLSPAMTDHVGKFMKSELQIL
ncbi:hypothetical protein C8R45DRAFT_1115581 [Mycena sanguinolenta]|nr:hypothetical protein C8R45DRAFT_1115581 [Mycena sanguinolenta]